MGKVAFINAIGGTMYVDESRVDEYKAMGYSPVADVIDTTCVIVDEKPKTEEVKKPVAKKKTTKKKEV